MEWKEIVTYCLGGLIVFLCYFLAMLAAGKVRDESGNVHKCWLIAHFVVLLMIVVGTCISISIHLDRIKEERVTPDEKDALSPRIDVVIDQSSVPDYEYPLKRYDLFIQNRNSKSVTVLDFTMEFTFSNIITAVEESPFLPTGGAISTGGLEVYEKSKDGTTYHYKEQPAKTVKKDFSLEARTAKINGRVVNTNVALFRCEKWPKGAAFDGKIVIDLSKRHEIGELPSGKIGRYVGKYSYQIKAKTFTEKLKGHIPNLETFEKKDTIIKFDLNLFEQFSKLNPKKGKVLLDITHEGWLERNNKLFEFIPHLTKDDLELRIYRDTDNVFKVLISNSYGKKFVLKYDDLEKLKNRPNHPEHSITVQWDDRGTKLFIDGVLVDIYPKDAKGYNQWGIVFGKQGEYTEAIRKLKKAIEIDSENAAAYSNWGFALIKLEDYEGAIHKYTKAIKIDPNCVNAQKGLLNAYVEWGLILVKGEDCQGAIEKFKKATEIDPKNPKWFFNWGLALENLEDYEGAVGKYKEAIKIDPQYAKPYLQWGNVLAKQDKLAEATVKYQKAIEVDPKYTLAYYNLGALLKDQGKHLKAADNFKKAIEQSPHTEIATRARAELEELDKKINQVSKELNTQ